MSLVMVLFVIFPQQIIQIFTQEVEVLNYGVQALRIMGTAFIFYGVGMVMTSAFNGAGDTKIPTIINLVSFWVVQIPLAYFLALGLNLKATGSFLAIPIAQTFMTLLALYYFRKGHWKKVKV